MWLGIEYMSIISAFRKKAEAGGSDSFKASVTHSNYRRILNLLVVDHFPHPAYQMFTL